MTGLLKSAFQWLLLLAFFLGVSYLLLAPLFRGHEEDATAPELASSTIEPVVVTVGEVEKRSVRRTVEVVGTLFGFEEIAISSNVDGRVSRLDVDVASRVAPGQQLIEIEKTNYELNVRQAVQAMSVELAKLGLSEIPENGFAIETLPAIREARSRLNFAENNAKRTRAGTIKRRFGTGPGIGHHGLEHRPSRLR
ncbi:MAG: biotin/lipoyl-binding protein [Pirellulaceae bacterium]